MIYALLLIAVIIVLASWYVISVLQDMSMDLYHIAFWLTASPDFADLCKDEDRRNHWHCSKCGTTYSIGNVIGMKYCPNCGIKFKKEIEHDEIDFPV